jgi:hypothetical protein
LHNAKFFQADLSQPLTDAEWAAEGFSAVLLDPPRDGAFEVVRKLKLWAPNGWYVSCNPATLARDTVELVKQGYRLKRAGILDMFLRRRMSRPWRYLKRARMLVWSDWPACAAAHQPRVAHGQRRSRFDALNAS